MTTQTIPDPSAPCTGANFPRPHAYLTLQDIELEQQILAEVLLHPDRFPNVAHIPVAAFSTTQHRIVWTGMLSCHSNDKIPDLPTLALELRASGFLDAIGVLNVLALSR